MKKILMFSASALVCASVFISCHNDIDNSATTVYQTQYNLKFYDSFGQVASNQNWGFGPSATRATRSNPGEDYPATHTYADGGANANANEWADPSKEFGGWLVPDPLTEGQKLRVQKYFQANPNLSYEDPHFRHFFVQQVYKGKTAPGENSTEEVIAANGSKYTSDNMNHLTVGQSNMHINNFNAGTCSMNYDVLDNGSNVNENKHHSDQIMLMVNIDDTSCFGYHDSGSSNEEGTTNHNDKAALVSAAVIDAWAAQNGNPGEAVVDKWNRSFMGFDLAIKEGKQVYAKDNDGNVMLADFSQAPESPKYAWDGTKIIEIADPNKSWPIEYYDDYKYIMKDGEPIGWLTTNENFYIADDKVTLDQSYQVNGGPEDLDGVKNAVILKEFTVDGTKYQSVINLPRINQLVNGGYLPVNNKNLQDWVQVGVSDGYFSDWIVTLTEAKRTDTNIDPDAPVTKTLRIMAEDLSVKDASDFDFNDVVFDVEANFPRGVNSVNEVKITIWAAGGTLPLRINTFDGNGGIEVHQALGYPDVKTMIDTHAERYGIDPYKWADNATACEETITLVDGGSVSRSNFESDINTNLPIVVQKDESTWVLITAYEGEPAAKIGVPVGTPWALEKHNMNNAFTNFKSWVNTAVPMNWYVSTVETHLYNNGKSTIFNKFQ